MIDFHSHVLPKMDDGPKSLRESLEMLNLCFQQGVDAVVSTSHFYADREDPRAFLLRRNRRLQALQEAMLCSTEVYPRIIPGAEVLYFPGISQAREVAELSIAGRAILIEPPMAPWSDDMLDEIVCLGENFDRKPVVAHVDRYMRMLGDNGLIDRVLERGLLVQVNGSYFLDEKRQKAAIRNLKKGKIHLLGSDCHNLFDRAPNLGSVRRVIRGAGAETEFRKLQENALELLGLEGELV